MWQKIIVWLITEIILNLLGIDDLADYSEFIFEKQVINLNSSQLSAVSRQLNAYVSEKPNQPVFFKEIKQSLPVLFKS
ncbi:MAG: hypothetical protein F6J90_37315 [Moorea sp. SIOASIH]|uniref:hypothetical protein n=1 Tax=Moorena sp. SIOASIH TaxID=2607817 RepID=UPI0013BDA9F1|nr:hypothetical protein [Moorena sp. SIOASIH]NEO41679.1 hypothetical protein [Moorena sp. SIOASIH]